MTSAEEMLAANAGASLNARLRDLERRIADIRLPEIPLPSSGPQDSRRAAAVIQALSTEIERLCEKREVNAREAKHWLTLSERAVRTNDGVGAKEALTRHALHLNLFHEADTQLNEFRALLTDVIRLLSKPEVAPTASRDENLC